MATSRKKSPKRKKQNSTRRVTVQKKSKKGKSSTRKLYQRKNRRNKTKYPALNPQFNLRSRTELLDYDYLNKLTDKELKYLNKFTEEFVNASVDVKKRWRNLHKTKTLIKDCFNKNNSRNRDILTQQKAMGKHIYLDDIQNIGNYNDIQSIEDRIDMQLLNIIDDEGNLIADNPEILHTSKKPSSQSTNRRKKRN